MCIDLKNVKEYQSSGRGMTLCLAVVVMVLLWWVLSLLPAAIDQAFQPTSTSFQAPGVAGEFIYNPETYTFKLVGHGE